MPAFKLTRPLSVALRGTTSVSGNVVVPAVSAFTLSGPTSAITGVAATYTVTPNGVLGSTVIVTISAPGATTSVGTLTFTSGSSAAQSFTVTRSTDGTTSVSITNNGGLSNTGSPISLSTTTLATSGAVATFTLTSDTTQAAAPFTVGHAFRQGEIPSTIAITGANAQATVKNSWPDGSVKFAVISGTASVSAGVATTVFLASGAASSGTALTTADLIATGVQTAVTAGAFGSASFGSTEWASPFATWISGHRMSSWIYRKQIGADAHLVAWMEVRLYSTGAVEILPWVENGYINVPSPGAKSATYTFSINGVQRFSGAIDLWARARTVLISGTILSHWVGTDPGITVQHDGNYLQSTDLVPAYSITVSSNSSLIAQIEPATFVPMQQGSYRTQMADTGYHPSIGLLPQWDVLYLTCTNPATYGGVIRQGYSAGRYSSHYRDESTQRPPRFSQHPTATVNTAAQASGGAIAYDTGHHPSMGYLAYLITGRFYFMEEVQFVATYNYLRQSATFNGQQVRQGVKGLFISASGDVTVRGTAWCIRTLTQAVNVTPDSDVLQSELVASLQHNIDYNHTLYVATPNNPYGIVEPYINSYGTQNGHQLEAFWQQDFYTAAFGYALACNTPINSTSATKLRAFFEWKAKSVVGRLSGVGANNWLYCDAASYYSEVAVAGASWAGSGPWPSSWGEMYEWNTGTRALTDPATLRGGNFPGAASYWGNLMPAIAYAVKHKVPDAAAGLYRLRQATNWSTFTNDLAGAPEWAVADMPLPPSWAPAAGATANISLNNYSDVNYPPGSNWATSYINSSPWRNWCGAALADGYSHYGAMVYWGGGHNGGNGTDAYAFDFTTRRWSRIGPGDPPGDYVRDTVTTNPGLCQMDPTWCDYPWAGGNIVPAVHSYSYPIYVGPEYPSAGTKGKWVLPVVVFGPLYTPDGVAVYGGTKPHYIDLATGLEDRWTTNIVSLPGGGEAGTFIDPRRGKLYFSKAPGSTIAVVDLNSAHPRTVTTQAMGPRWMAENNAYYPNYIYCWEADRILEFSCGYGSIVPRLAIYSTSTGSLVHTGYANISSGAPGLDAGYGADWCPITGKFYIYNGSASTTVYTLRPSNIDDLLGSTWTWGTETFSGPAWQSGRVDTSGNSRPHSRWRYIPRLRSFAWTDANFGAVCQDGQLHDTAHQLWRPANT